MKFVNLANSKIIQILEEIQKACFDEDYLSHLSTLSIEQSLYTHKHSPVSKNYLDELFAREAIETARAHHTLLYDFSKTWLNTDFTAITAKKSEEINPLIKKLCLKLNMQANPLAAYYPNKGYIGWHHNGDASGWNVLFTYSQDGDGFLKYRDTETGEIVTLPDPKGWSAKMGYYPSLEEVPKDKLFWHCAYTEKERITIAFNQKSSGEFYKSLKNVLEK